MGRVEELRRGKRRVRQARALLVLSGCAMIAAHLFDDQLSGVNRRLYDHPLSGCDLSMPYVVFLAGWFVLLVTCTVPQVQSDRDLGKGVFKLAGSATLCYVLLMAWGDFVVGWMSGSQCAPGESPLVNNWFASCYPPTCRDRLMVWAAAILAAFRVIPAGLGPPGGLERTEV